MGVKRVVDIAFWTDDKVVDMFSPEDKLFMLYLLTNPHTTQLGIYKINEKQMAFEIGWSRDTVQVLLERFEKKYELIMLSPETKEIAIKNYLKHSIVKGGQPVEDLLNKEIGEVKNVALLKYVIDSIKDYKNLNKTVHAIIKKNDNDNANDNDNDNDVSYPDSYHDSSKPSKIEPKHYNNIISYLNKKAQTNYKSTSAKTRSLIDARLKDFTEADFYTVIDKKVKEWLGDSKMQGFLRPETLFGTKFESYLNQREVLTEQEKRIANLRDWKGEDE